MFRNEDRIIKYRQSLEVWNNHTQIYRADNLSQQKLIDIRLAIPQTYPIYVLFELLMGSFLAFRRFWALRGKCHGPLARWVKLRVRMRRECRERFPATAGMRFRHASRHVRDARAVMHTGIAYPRFPLNSAAGEIFPGIPVACATLNFTYLVRGPCWTILLLAAPMPPLTNVPS